MKSIIEKISKDKNDKISNKINAVKVLDNLFFVLSERERDVLKRRFGLHGDDKETLEEVGKIHNLTRERIRQIESSSINKLKKSEDLNKEIQFIKSAASCIMEEHGGLMEKEYFLKSLAFLSAEFGKGRKKDGSLHLNYLDFLVSKLLSDHFEEIESSSFKPSFKLKDISLNHLEKLADDLHDEILRRKNTYKTDLLIEILMNLNSYKQHAHLLERKNDLDMSHVLDGKLFGDVFEIINNNKVAFSAILSSNKIGHNRFGHWGSLDWREIRPKTINDKIYIVLKNCGKPMHFSDISGSIKEAGFDRKRPNVATVHNELILDGKYVLVGRGMYGLKEWGYKEGTVTDVIKEILASNAEPMAREEIVEKVLENRMVKKTTIILALMDKDNFKRVGDRYVLIS